MLDQTRQMYLEGQVPYTTFDSPRIQTQLLDFAYYSNPEQWAE